MYNEQFWKKQKELYLPNTKLGLHIRHIVLDLTKSNRVKHIDYIILSFLEFRLYAKHTVYINGTTIKYVRRMDLNSK